MVEAPAESAWEGATELPRRRSPAERGEVPWRAAAADDVQSRGDTAAARPRWLRPVLLLIFTAILAVWVAAAVAHYVRDLSAAQGARSSVLGKIEDASQLIASQSVALNAVSPEFGTPSDRGIDWNVKAEAALESVNNYFSPETGLGRRWLNFQNAVASYFALVGGERALRADVRAQLVAQLHRYIGPARRDRTFKIDWKALAGAPVRSAAFRQSYHELGDDLLVVPYWIGRDVQRDPVLYLDTGRADLLRSLIP